jgi:hypothetical protein
MQVRLSAQGAIDGSRMWRNMICQFRIGLRRVGVVGNSSCRISSGPLFSGTRVSIGRWRQRAASPS